MNKVIKVIPLSGEDRVAFGKKHVNALVALLQKGMDQFHPKEKIELLVENQDSEDVSVVAHPTGFSIDLIEIEQKAIGRTMIVPAWQLTGWRHVPSTRWEPEDYEDVPVSEHCNYRHAVAALIKAISNDDVDRWMCDEWQSEEEEI